MLERRARPDDVRRAVHTLRDAGFDNISLDLIYGIPGQSASDLERDLAEALALEPEHLSCYELEAKPGTRFTHAHGAELERQAEAMEGYFEQVVDALTGAGYRWYETANFCLEGEAAARARSPGPPQPRVLVGRDYLGLGIGAVSTVAGVRRRNLPGLGRYLARARRRRRSRRASSRRSTTRRERASGCCSGSGWTSRWRCTRSTARSTARPRSGWRRTASSSWRRDNGRSTVTLTRRGRFLGGGVTAELLV